MPFGLAFRPYAANKLGLSEQVPMKIVFYTDGPTRSLQVENNVSN